MKSQIRMEHQFGLFETSSNIHINSEFSVIDQQSDKARKALQELASTYEYASKCVSHTYQTAKRMHEMQAPEEQSADPELNTQASFQEFTRKVEHILDRLAAKLTQVIRQDRIETFFQRGLYPLQSAWNELSREIKEW